MDDCIFCKIIKGDIPSAVIYEDEEFKAILDRFPSGPGHVLILPKSHAANIFELDPACAGRLFQLAAKLSKPLCQVLGVENLNILQNNGPIAGQTVNHFHLHLIPRREKDGIQITWTPTEPTDQEIETLRQKIQTHLSQVL